MGVEHSQQRAAADGREVFEGDLKADGSPANASSSTSRATPSSSGNIKRRSMLLRQNTPNSNNRRSTDTASPTTSSELSRPPSPPLSVCSDLPYVSYTDKPIGGDSPKMRNKPHSGLPSRSLASRKSHPSGAKPKRQSTSSGHNIVIVRPGTRDFDSDIDPDLAQLHSIPQFMPVLRDSVTSATFTRDPEMVERLQSQHLQKICSRMQLHLNLCATQVSTDQNQLVERTKVVSNSITTLFACFVDMQKAYASYAEQFVKIRSISQQLSRCNSLLNENIASLETINNFLDVEDRLDPFVWRTDDKFSDRGEAEGASGGGGGRIMRRV